MAVGHEEVVRSLSWLRPPPTVPRSASRNSRKTFRSPICRRVAPRSISGREGRSDGAEAGESAIAPDRGVAVHVHLRLEDGAPDAMLTSGPMMQDGRWSHPNASAAVGSTIAGWMNVHTRPQGPAESAPRGRLAARLNRDPRPRTKVRPPRPGFSHRRPCLHPVIAAAVPEDRDFEPELISPLLLFFFSGTTGRGTGTCRFRKNRPARIRRLSARR